MQQRPRLTGLAGSPFTATARPLLIPTRRPQPTPQNRQGVFLQATPSAGSGVPAEAANRMPGNMASAARSSPPWPPSMSGARAGSSPCLLRRVGFRIGTAETRNQREALEELHAGQRALEGLLGNLVRRVGDDDEEIAVDGGDTWQPCQRAQRVSASASRRPFTGYAR